MPSSIPLLLTAVALIALSTTVLAHSWLECTSHDNSALLPWMQGNSTLSPPVIIDPAMPWYSQYCHGWPRNKANPGNWIDESSNYVWNIAANSWNGGSYHPADTHACHPSQRSPAYEGNAPMATAAPGGNIRLMFGGNGHSRGYNVGGEPGTVSVYWKGAPEQEITDISEFTPANLLQSAGFSDDSFSYPADPNIKTPPEGLVDKGNWMVLNLPETMQPGRHMMAWVWYYKTPAGVVAPQWSTCFDVMIQGNAQSPAPASSVSTGRVGRDGIPLIKIQSVTANKGVETGTTALANTAVETSTFTSTNNVISVTVTEDVRVTVHPTLTKQVLASVLTTVTDGVEEIVAPGQVSKWSFQLWRPGAHARRFA